MYHVSAQGIDERMINVHYYYSEGDSGDRWCDVLGFVPAGSQAPQHFQF